MAMKRAPRIYNKALRAYSGNEFQNIVTLDFRQSNNATNNSNDFRFSNRIRLHEKSLVGFCVSFFEL